MNSSKAKRMTAEAIRAEACERLRKVGDKRGTERARAHLGKVAAGWRLQWCDSYAAILVPHPHEPEDAGRRLPGNWADYMIGAELAPVRILPHRDMARAVHVLQAVARGLCSQAVELEPDEREIRMHYRAPEVGHTARAWAAADTTINATIFGEEIADKDERAAVVRAQLDAARLHVNVRYLAAAWWADEAAWTASKAGAALVLAAPEVRIVIHGMATDEAPAGGAQ